MNLYALKNINNIIPEELFNIADTNSDGVLDINEFYRLIASIPELRNNFSIIIENTIHKHKIKLYESRTRIFKNDITGRRPSLSDVRSVENICSSDVPLYGVYLPESASTITHRRYGH